MVDAFSSIDSMDVGFSGRAAAKAVDDRSLEASVYIGKGDAAGQYSALCRQLLFAPAQSPAWISAWAAHASSDLIVIGLSKGGRPVMAFALETVAAGPFGVARFVGGRHANGNFPAVNPTSSVSPAFTATLIRALREARPDIDLLALERQSPVLGGLPNPMLSLSHCRSPNIALAADLSGGFEALLGRINGKRKRKKHRSQMRKFEAAGGFRHLQARTPEEVGRFLSAFFSMKAEQLAKAGLPNCFGSAHTRAAFTALFQKACLKDRPDFVLQALEVGGKLRAVSGAGLAGNRVMCEFTAFANDELAAAAPGDFLFFENIRAACEEGFEIYDFGVGDERYKREWCDIETEHFDIFLPVSAKGRLLTEARYALSFAKRRLKASPLARDLLMRLRRMGGDG